MDSVSCLETLRFCGKVNLLFTFLFFCLLTSIRKRPGVRGWGSTCVYRDGVPCACTHVHRLTLHCFHSHFEDGVILVELAFHHSSKLSYEGPEGDVDIRGALMWKRDCISCGWVEVRKGRTSWFKGICVCAGETHLLPGSSPGPPYAGLPSHPVASPSALR